VEFRLRYAGSLPSSGSADLRKVKHDIRKQLHPQLLDLSERNPAVNYLFNNVLGRVPSKSSFSSPLAQSLYDPTHFDASAVGEKGKVGKFQFAPLIVGAVHMVCHLDILFLRREAPGSLIMKPKDEYGGDLDNRLKIFFDGLKMPCFQDLPKDAAPEDGEHPFLCLLEDDSLITKFQVESDTLLGITNSTNQTDVELIVAVTTRLTQITLANVLYIG